MITKEGYINSKHQNLYLLTLPSRMSTLAAQKCYFLSPFTFGTANHPVTAVPLYLTLILSLICTLFRFFPKFFSFSFPLCFSPFVTVFYGNATRQDNFGPRIHLHSLPWLRYHAHISQHPTPYKHFHSWYYTFWKHPPLPWITSGATAYNYFFSTVCISYTTTVAMNTIVKGNWQYKTGTRGRENEGVHTGGCNVGYQYNFLQTLYRGQVVGHCVVGLIPKANPACYNHLTKYSILNVNPSSW